MTDQAFNTVNLRASSYLVAQCEAPCTQCGLRIELVALALPSEHQTREPDRNIEAAEFADDAWQIESGLAFLFFVEHLPEAVRRRLAQFSRNYRFAFSQTTIASYWANHCSNCGAIQDDQDLFCEPTGAFLPTDPGSAAAITLNIVDEPFEAAAAGYAVEPQFLELMPRR